MSATFADLGLPAPLLGALATEGLDEPFAIQAASIPPILDGSDVSGHAPTGSGKTLAFGLPIIARVGVAQPNRPRALILTPTRELAAQIRKDLAPYGKAVDRQIFAVYGGVRYGAQIDWLRRGIDVLVATPGRLEDLIQQGAADLSEVDLVAVDEADRMADLGFMPSVRRIIDQTSPDRQMLLFSATLDGEVGKLVRRYQTAPITVEAGIAADDLDVEHLFWSVEHKEKVEETARVVNTVGDAIVFTRTRHGADRLARQLARRGVRAESIHGGLSQNQRNRALAAFKSGNIDALIATDVVARGIHVEGVSSVIHFDPPNGHKDYVHRSGRTARAGAAGVVVSLITHPERRASNRLQRSLGLDTAITKPDLHRLHGLVSVTDAPRAHRSRAAHPQASERRTRGGGRRADGSRARGTKNGQRNPTTASGSEIVVSNLPWSTTDADLRRLFAKYGAVHAATVKQDRRGRSKGVGIVSMRPGDAPRAVQSMNGRRVGGRPLKVRHATHAS
ncbi:MAG: DEAD/DEAH box helicase [Acidimicrobiia bacterium]|nr:DEAD/DEAH box helicase [Acidimicrobiia bacterium]